MFEKISIQNLRGIKSLTVSDLSRINIFVGPNNSGKTTILESIFLLIGMSNPQLYLNINNFRGLTSTEVNDLKFNFRNLDISNKIILEAFEKKDGMRKLKISPLFLDTVVEPLTNKDSTIESLGEASSAADTSISQKASGISYQFTHGMDEESSYTSKLYFEQGVLKLTLAPTYTEKLNGRILNGYDFWGSLSDRVNRLQRDKRKDILIKFLKIIDSKVEDIALGLNKLVYIDIGIDQMIPISLMGDGFLKACSAMANILISEDGFLMVDEIENGLHYKTLKLLWKSMLEVSRDSNVQMFIATHSYEAIKSLLSVVSENNYSKEDIRLYSLARSDTGAHRLYKYAFENIEASIESDIEIRGQ